MEIKIMGKMRCIQHTYSDNVKPCAIISINCPSDIPPRLTNHPNVEDVMCLYFDDIEQRHIEIGSNGKLMTEEDAYEIYKFAIANMEDNIEEVIVHCHAGVSRSSAVAAGICLIMGMDDMWIWNGNYLPNRHVFTTLNKYIGLSNEEIEYRYKVNKEYHINEDYNEIEGMFVVTK